MSDRDRAIELIEQIPEYKLSYVIAYLEGAALPDKIPNKETIEAIEEIEQMIKTGSGQHFKSVDALFADLEE